MTIDPITIVGPSSAPNKQCSKYISTGNKQC